MSLPFQCDFSDLEFKVGPKTNPAVSFVADLKMPPISKHDMKTHRIFNPIKY